MRHAPKHSAGVGPLLETDLGCQSGWSASRASLMLTEECALLAVMVGLCR
jgi:hypothetical protein